MIVGIHATKLIVRDVEAAERFYVGIGLKVVSHNIGGEGSVRQRQCWVSVTGDNASHMLILSQFLEVEAPPTPAYPGQFWLAFNVADVDGLLAQVEQGGGMVLRAGEDRPEHGVRAAVVQDPEGHIIEIVGPMRDAAAGESVA